MSDDTSKKKPTRRPTARPKTGGPKAQMGSKAQGQAKPTPKPKPKAKTKTTAKAQAKAEEKSKAKAPAVAKPADRRASSTKRQAKPAASRSASQQRARVARGGAARQGAGATPEEPRRQTGPIAGAVAAVGSVAGGVRSGRPSLARMGEFAQRHRAPLVACLAVVVVLAALYGPARNLYCAWRDNARLLAEQSAATTEKDLLEGDIATLTTKEGVQDQAREMGYVEDGEKRIVVEGEKHEETDERPEETEEDPWYLAPLDLVFGYEEEK